MQWSKTLGWTILVLITKLIAINNNLNIKQCFNDYHATLKNSLSVLFIFIVTVFSCKGSLGISRAESCGENRHYRRRVQVVVGRGGVWRGGGEVRVTGLTWRRQLASEGDSCSWHVWIIGARVKELSKCDRRGSGTTEQTHSTFCSFHVIHNRTKPLRSGPQWRLKSVHAGPTPTENRLLPVPLIQSNPVFVRLIEESHQPVGLDFVFRILQKNKLYVFCF